MPAGIKQQKTAVKIFQSESQMLTISPKHQIMKSENISISLEKRITMNKQMQISNQRQMMMMMMNKQRKLLGQTQNKVVRRNVNP